MPTQNRDQERLYRPGKLSTVFAVASTALLIVLVWMFWQDHARPWKDYQRAFRKTQLAVATQKVKTLERATEGLADLLAAEKQAQQRLADLPAADPELARLEERLPALRQALADAEAYEKTVKGLVSPARYQFELAVHEHAHGHVSAGVVADRLDAFNRYASELHRAVLRLRAAQADHDAVAAQAAARRKPAEDAVREAGRALSAYRGAQATVDGLTQRYDRNTWRNWAVLDILSRSIEIKQVVLKDIHDNWNFATNVKVDRCMTCHLGVDQPDLSDARIAELYADEIAKAYGLNDDSEESDRAAALVRFKQQHGIERWMQAHPAGSLIAGPAAVHGVETTGCTVCHAGVGWSTDFSRAAHTPADAAQKAAWKADHGWKPPEFVDYPMLVREYVQGQCFKCHKQGFGWPVPYVERLEHGGVVVDARGRLKPLAQTFVGADGVERALAPLELSKGLRLPDMPDPVDGPRSEVARVRELHERERLGEAYDPSMVQGHGWDAQAYDLGEESITRYGCQGCHKIADFGEQVGADPLPRVGPELTHVAHKVRPEWLERWIKHPDAYRIDTRMPSFFWYVPKDADWQAVDAAGQPLPKGERRPLSVLDSHLFDRDPKVREVGPLTTPGDEAFMSLSVRAMTLYLLALGREHPRTEPGAPGYNPTYAKDPLPGDWERGREVVGNDGYGCVACHVVPEVKDDSGAWVRDDGARFGGEPAKGPRIDTLGSKYLPDGRALNAWLERPRHLTATTAMPHMRWRDVVAADGRVLVSAEQVRADVVAYLLRYADAKFDALPGAGWDESWTPLLTDLYEEFFGRTDAGALKRASEVQGELDRLGRDAALARLGEKLMARNGCFGCHAVAGHESDQPIGTELTREGSKDLHQLDFGYVHAVPHTRAGFLRTKIAHPRIWDAGKSLRWTDRLRMPRFNFRMDDGVEGRVSTRAAVAGLVLGLVDEKLQPGALYAPDEATRDVIRFRRVVDRYGCNNCHPLEGQASVLWRFLKGPLDPEAAATPDDYAPSGSFDLKYVAPNLFGEGHKAQAGWLQAWLRDPYDLRPMVKQRMPRFELDQAEADALVAGFQRLAGQTFRVNPQPASKLEGREYLTPVEIAVADSKGATVAARTVRNAVEEAEFLFDTINCNKCHLPKGSPGADPVDGGVAPPLKYAGQRLGREWVNVMLNHPPHLLGKGTPMILVWQFSGFGRQIDKAYEPFQFGLRDDPGWQRLWRDSEGGTKPGPARDEATRRLAAAQREALADYVVHHYRWPRNPPAEPR